MTREIKFRAWVQTNTKLKPLMFNHEDFIENEGHPLRRKGVSMLPLKADGYIWMQYTGLKDKLGKEIYEGDIIHVKLHHMIEGKEYWENQLVVIEDLKSFFERKVVDEKIDGYATSYQPENLEILGNIYENPNLVKELTGG